MVNVTRLGHILLSDDRRVITRLFLPSDKQRVRRVVDRVLALPEEEAQQLLQMIVQDFGHRHHKIEEVFENHFREATADLDVPDTLTTTRRRLIGAYFTKEYSIEAAALFNPSIVPHPDQSTAPPGGLRFILSLRATGEGHVSSIAFRTGTIDKDGQITIDPVGRFVQAARKVKDRTYHKQTFFLKLIEMGAYNDFAGNVLDRLADEFKYDDLLQAIGQTDRTGFDPQFAEQTAASMRWLARSNYHLTFPEDCDIPGVVLFPVSETESRGIEDARFVRFCDEDGTVTYYGTYTAYDGLRVLPQLLQTTDFRHFRITTLNGRYAQNKGLALFPRKVNGWYMMISRTDGENIYLMRSTNVRFWNEAQRIQTPRYPWEFVQIGNCGSPLETPRGWLLLTHGVGPMRRYCIGVSLLDLEDPSRVIAQLPEPLLAPDETEREGYVPNVVYSCGALIHNGLLVLPYAVSDSATTFATVNLDEILCALVPC